MHRWTLLINALKRENWKDLQAFKHCMKESEISWRKPRARSPNSIDLIFLNPKHGESHASTLSHPPKLCCISLNDLNDLISGLMASWWVTIHNEQLPGVLRAEKVLPTISYRVRYGFCRWTIWLGRLIERLTLEVLSDRGEGQSAGVWTWSLLFKNDDSSPHQVNYCIDFYW